MEQVVSATEARVHFGELMRRVVESDTPVIVERDGTAQMVVMSMRTYTRLQNGTQTGDWLALVDQARAQIRADLGGRPIEPPPEEIIRQMREERDAQLTGLR